MLTIDEAREVASAHLRKELPAHPRLVLVDSATEAFDAGWVFYYQSEECVSTGDPRYALAGNAPLFVPRLGLPPRFIGYHRPTIESMAAYAMCGDVNALPNAEVELCGCRDDAQAVAATRVVRDASLLGLTQAKAAIEACRAGGKVRIRVNTVLDARGLEEKLKRLGFVATLTYGR